MKKYLSQALLCLVACLLMIAGSAYAGDGTVFRKIIFFGDSLSDNGNIYSADLGYLPKSPPYYQGRFSNGPVWAEYVDTYYYNKSGVISTNFALGGESTLWQDRIYGYLPYSLSTSLDSYLLRTAFQDRTNVLFVIFIGANDYFDATADADKLTQEVVGRIVAATDSLVRHGAKNLLIINLPNIGRSPFAIENSKVDLLSDYATKHNARLAAAVADLQNDYKTLNIQLFDANKLFDDLIDHTDVFNKKYNLNIKFKTTACWQGGYTLTANGKKQISQDEIQANFEAYLKKHQSKTMSMLPDAVNPSQLNTKGFAELVATSPALREAYAVTEGGYEECSNPDEHIFWDHIHPTAGIHKALSQEVIGFIDQHFQQ